MIARTPEPPYVAMIFASVRREGQADYGPLARKRNAEHREAQRLGRKRFYTTYALRVATVGRQAFVGGEP